MATSLDAAPQRSRRGRGTLAVLAGLVMNVVLGVGIDQILRAAGVFPPAGRAMGDSRFAIPASWLGARLYAR